MITNNRLDKSFGPVGTYAGIIVFFAGIIISFSSFSALILVFIGAFVGFSSTSALIDYDKKRVKFSNNLFGILKIGHWINIEQDMTDQDYRIVLFDSNNKEIMPIKKVNTLDSAKVELDKSANQLGIKSL